MKLESHSLKIENHIEMTFLNYGGIIQSIRVPDKSGKMDDIVLGFDDPKDYLQAHPYFGALIGRYANRIREGKFRLQGEQYSLAVNNPPNSLHGGLTGLDKVFWKVESGRDGRSFILSHESPDGHEGYPGKLKIEVTYTITMHRELVIDYKATTDKTTHVNFTNHTYFNLSGEDDLILDHELWINADHFTNVNDDLTPTGEIFTLKGSKDFREHKKIGRDIGQLPGGYDHNYVLNDGPFRDPKARLVHPVSGRILEVFTTEPGLQFYSGNFLDGTLTGKNGIKYQKHQGLCLETQHFPDSPNHSHFPSTLLRPGETYTSKTMYKFSS